MSLQIEYFLNSFKSLIASSLDWMSDAQMQRKSWSTKSSFPDFDNFVEDFLSQAKRVLHTAEYKHFINESACIHLKKLYDKVCDFYMNPEKVINSRNKEQLLVDLQWIEIQKLAKKAKTEITEFIKKHEVVDE